MVVRNNPVILDYKYTVVICVLNKANDNGIFASSGMTAVEKIHYTIDSVGNVVESLWFILSFKHIADFGNRIEKG